MSEENRKLAEDNFEQELRTDLDDDTPDAPKGLALHTKILIGLLVGVIGGLIVNWTWGGNNPWVVWTVENFTRPIGQLFLNLLLMIVVPLVFASLVVGVAGIGDIRKLGRIGFKSFGYSLVICRATQGKIQRRGAFERRKRDCRRRGIEKFRRHDRQIRRQSQRDCRPNNDERRRSEKICR
jgi:hypothetical protein